MTEDVPPQVTKDIPDVTEDVPHVDEDIPIADVDADGAEGSPADHDEGFPGRPHDTSVLTSFADHVAYSIWSGEVILFFIFCCVVCFDTIIVP